MAERSPKLSRCFSRNEKEQPLFNTTRTIFFASLFAAVGLVGLVACGDDAETAGQTGRVRLLLTDAPLDGVEEVNVTFDSVEVSGPGGWKTVTSSVQTFDLLELQGGITAELGLTELSTGTYGQIRLMLTDAWLVIDGEDVGLRVPSADQTGLKLVSGFEVLPDVETQIVLDFDAEESVHRTGNGQWMMRPTIRIISTSTTAIPDDELDEPEDGSNGSDGGANGSDPGGL